MFKLIGALVGLVLGDRIHEVFLFTVLLAAIGFAIGAFADRPRARVAASVAQDPNVRLAAIERRLDAIERTLAAPGVVPSVAPVVADDTPPSIETVAPRAWVPAPIVTVDDAAIPPRPAYGAAQPTPIAAPPIVPGAVVASPTPSTPPSPPRRSAWAWFTEGNTLTRVGVVILIFGVAFLLSWFADYLTLSVEATLALVALAGAALVGLGLWLARTRPGYGISLEGAGAGILYLTTFAASRLFDVLPPLA